MIKVSPRAKRHDDNAGDPLDGLVNLFDLGIVLSVGFLLAALSSLNLASTFTQGSDGGAAPDGSISVPADSQVSQVPTDGATVIGQGEQVGTVYRLADGRLVYVLPPSGAPATGPSNPSGGSTSSPVPAPTPSAAVPTP